MSFAAGAKLGNYEILSPLGAGGMGEVYRAHDLRLRRDVAVKALPVAVAANPDRLAKFRREAQVLASLNHPNIGAIYGLEEIAGQPFLILELVEGEDLSEIIKRGPIPVPEALSIARQICAALEAAHDKGVVHRDLKPANVKVGTDGKVKVLDFGLAKAISNDPAISASYDLANSPTFTGVQTMPGVILGTAPYMSPEQARGKPVDKRADIWSFGIVLFEMLTGKQLFDGDTVSDVLASLLTREPRWSDLPPNTPASVRRLLHRTFQKDPRLRLRDIGDAALELEQPDIVDAAPTVREAPSRARTTLPWMLAALIAILALALIAMRFNAPHSEVHSVRLAMPVPPHITMNDDAADPAVISPDGQKIVFAAKPDTGPRQLFLRLLNSSDVQPLPGTEDPLLPFWSPDSRSIAFGSHGKLKRFDLGAGNSQIICDAARLIGGTWNTQGMIVFGPDYRVMASQVPATGGEPKRATSEHFDPELEQSSPSFLPDGKHFVYRASTSGAPSGVWLGALDSAEKTQLLPDDSDVTFAPPNYLLFVRNDVLTAQALDLDKLRLVGAPISIMARPSANARPRGIFSASSDGTLIWQGNFERRLQLLWLDRAGNQVGSVTEPSMMRSSQEARISPDGTRVVYMINSNVWVSDVARHTAIRLTSETTQLPVWSHDGSSVIFSGRADGKSGVLSKAATGIGEAQQVSPGGALFSHDASADGRFLICLRRGLKTRADLWVVPLTGDRTPYPLVDSPFDDVDPALSRDGHWLAYDSDESGDYEIYIRPFTPDGKVGADRKRISLEGGKYPRWRADGRELFYIARNGEMMSVPINYRNGDIEPGSPQPLFKTKTLYQTQNLQPYDVSADGKRFLISSMIGEPTTPPPTVILNWTAGK